MDKLVGENSQKILDLDKKVDIACTELKNVKERVSKLERRVDAVDEPVKLTQRKLDELDTYFRRWNLKLYGLPEEANEQVRQEAVKICQAVLPEEKVKLGEAIDVVHRLGKKRQNDSRPRPIILRFVARLYRDAVWRAAKNSAYLREHPLRFKVCF